VAILSKFCTTQAHKAFTSDLWFPLTTYVSLRGTSNTYFWSQERETS